MVRKVCYLMLNNCHSFLSTFLLTDLVLAHTHALMDKNIYLVFSDI